MNIFEKLATGIQILIIGPTFISSKILSCVCKQRFCASFSKSDAYAYCTLLGTHCVFNCMSVVQWCSF